MNNDLKIAFQDFRNLILESENIVIASHVNPDGDNLGSILATFEMLNNLGKKPRVIVNDFIPMDFRFLPNVDKTVKAAEIDFVPDLFIALDSGDKNRLGLSVELFNKSKKTVNIDHHKSNTKFADLNIVDEKATATGELLYRIFREIDLPINKNSATCLYTAISSDTGSFKYDSLTDYTFKVAGELLKYEIDTNTIAVNLYQSRSVEKTNLLIESLKDITYLFDNKVAIVKVTLENVSKVKAHPSDTEGIVEFIRDIEPVEVAILLKERKESVKLSLRTKSYINAINIAKHFDGGGHIRAAGATIHLDIKEAEKEVIRVITEEFK